MEGDYMTEVRTSIIWTISLSGRLAKIPIIKLENHSQNDGGPYKSPKDLAKSFVERMLQKFRICVVHPNRKIWIIDSPHELFKLSWKSVHQTIDVARDQRRFTQ